MSKASLAGQAVLVTRPEHQADALTDAIEDAGGTVVRFPVIDIRARDAAEVAAEARALPIPNIVVFISSNAVRYGLANAVDGSKIAAIGPATRAALEAAGHHVDIFPIKGYDSEHLLAAPALNAVAGKAVRIVCGSKGRELLASTLKKRGARVDYASVYERLPARHYKRDIDALAARLQRGSISSIVVMSVDSLKFLLDIVPELSADGFVKARLVTPSPRVIQTASELLPDTPTRLAAGPGTDDLIQALRPPEDRQ